MTTDELPSIDSSALDAVTGGATTSTSSNAQVTATLQSITNSLANLTSNSQNSQSSFSQLLPFLALSGGFGGKGACPCGCGMANCMRR